jgi:peptide deformylase
MVRDIIHDSIFLGQKSDVATKDDLASARDLLDTLIFHREECVGMAANMIGVKKRIIAFCDGNDYKVMFNPEIVKSSEIFETEEGCLSLLGAPRKTKRYKKIKVEYQNDEFKLRTKTFEGWTAQIIQHEIDHCNGILI